MQNSLNDVFRSEGAIMPSVLIHDEKPQRCGTEKKPRGTNGWYISYGNTVLVGNWEHGEGYSFWKENGETKLDAVDRSRIKALHEQRERERIEFADVALDYFESLPRTGYSDYLKRKQIESHGLRFDGTAIIMPIQDANGKIWSYQKIYGDGAKYFMPGGRVQGCYYTIFPARNIEKNERIIVCEGFATGASIYEATGLPVIIALNAGNLKAVTDSIPFNNIIIAADNDANGAGEKGAIATGYGYILPVKVGDDFSDVFLSDGGREKVADLFIAQEEKKELTLPLVGGLVGEIADWITATAVRPQPILSLAAALSFVGMLKGHRIKGYTDLRTNLLIMAMAPTGGGKEHPQAAIKKLTKLAGLQKHLMGEPVSGSGFLHALQKAGNVGFMVMDEIGRYVGNLSSASAGIHQREIIDYIIKTFAANSMLMGRERAPGAKEPRIDIDQPHFCCYGSTVYEKFRDSVGSGEIVDGFLNRWIVLESKERPDRRQKVKQFTPPQTVLDKIASIVEVSPYDSYGNPQPREQRFTPEAWEYFVTYRNLVDAMVNKAPYPLNQLYTRMPEHIEKMAHTMADSEWTGMPELKDAIQIAEFSNKCIAEFAGMISDNTQEKDFVRVREIIKEAGEIKRNTLTRRTQFITGGNRRRLEIVEALKDDGIIGERPLDGKMVAYKWIR